VGGGGSESFGRASYGMNYRNRRERRKRRKMENPVVQMVEDEYKE
jgi:hypothetical protein